MAAMHGVRARRYVDAAADAAADEVGAPETNPKDVLSFHKIYRSYQATPPSLFRPERGLVVMAWHAHYRHVLYM